MHRGLSLDNKRLDNHQDNIASVRQWKKPLTFLAPLFLGEQVAVYIWLARSYLPGRIDHQRGRESEKEEERKRERERAGRRLARFHCRYLGEQW